MANQYLITLHAATTSELSLRATTDRWTSNGGSVATVHSCMSVVTHLANEAASTLCTREVTEWSHLAASSCVILPVSNTLL